MMTWDFLFTRKWPHNVRELNCTQSASPFVHASVTQCENSDDCITCGSYHGIPTFPHFYTLAPTVPVCSQDAVTTNTTNLNSLTFLLFIPLHCDIFHLVWTGISFCSASLVIQGAPTTVILLWIQYILASIKERESVMPSCANTWFLGIFLCRVPFLLSLCGFNLSFTT